MIAPQYYETVFNQQPGALPSQEPNHKSFRHILGGK